MQPVLASGAVAGGRCQRPEMAGGHAHSAARRPIGPPPGFPARQAGSSPLTEPPEVFCSLGSLIVEGRVPTRDDRGYGEGPHVPPRGGMGGQRQSKAPAHECSEEEYMVSLRIRSLKFSKFR